VPTAQLGTASRKAKEASRKRKSFGVPKWSAPRRRDQAGVGQGLDQGVGRPGEVAVPEHDQHRPGQGGQVLNGEAAVGPAQAGGKGRPVIAGPGRELGERPGQRRVVTGGVALLDGPGDRLGVRSAEQVGAHSADHQPSEALRLAGGDGEEQLGAERETDGVDHQALGPERR